MNIFKKGSYPMGLMTPTPKGEIADLSLNLPGPQVYITDQGSLTVDEITLMRQEGNSTLYRVQGSFDANLIGSGTNVTEREPHVTGTFDVLLVSN